MILVANDFVGAAACYEDAVVNGRAIRVEIASDDHATIFWNVHNHDIKPVDANRIAKMIA